MKYIKLYGKYSLPNSVDILSKELTDFIYDLFNTWLSRKGLANYRNLYEFIPNTISEDFPVSIINLNISFVLTDKYGLLNSSGLANYFNDKENSSKIKDGMVIPMISIKLYVSKNKKSFNKQEIIDQLDPTITHELLHIYQFFKIKSKGITLTTNNSIFSHAIGYVKSKNFNNNILCIFLELTYICYDKFEVDAHLSQIYTEKGRDWISFLKLMNKSCEEIISYIKDELGNRYESLYKDFLYEYNSYDNAKKLNISSTDSLLRTFYEIISNKKIYLKKKINKIVNQ